MDLTTWRGKAGSALSRLQGTVHKQVKGWYRLKDFIRLVRKAPTKADERVLMAKESARVRSALKSADCQSDERWHGLAKLLFMHLHCNGQPAGYQHHQQQAIEFMKVVAAASATGSQTAGMTKGRSRLGVKRLGYFGATLLLADASSCSATLDTRTLSGVTVLLTNTLKQDLRDGGSAAVQCSALGCLAALPNQEMYLELAQAVIDLVSAPPPLSLSTPPPSHPPTRTSGRAAVCLSVMVERVPEIGEMLPGGVLEALLRQPDDVHQLAACYTVSALPPATLGDPDRHRLANLLVRQLDHSHTATLTISRLQAIQSLSCSEPEIIAGLCRFIEGCCGGSGGSGGANRTDTTRTNGSISYSQYGVLMEALRVVAGLDGREQTVRLVADRVGEVLVTAGHDPNIKLVALECLHAATCCTKKATNAVKAIAKHRAAILQCLKSDTDSLTLRLAIQLALAIVIDRKTLQVVLDHVTAVDVGLLDAADRHVIGERLVELMLVFLGGGEFVQRVVSVMTAFYADPADGDGEAVVKRITDRLLFTSSVPSPSALSALSGLCHTKRSTAATCLLVWLEGRHAKSVTGLQSLIGMLQIDDDVQCGHVLMACERMAARGINVDAVIRSLSESSTRRTIKEMCCFTAAVLRQAPDGLLQSVEPDLMAGVESPPENTDCQPARTTSDSRGVSVFEGTGLTVYMRRVPPVADASGDDGVLIQATLVNPIQHPAQPTNNVSLQVAVQKGLSVSLGPSSGSTLPPFSAKPITQDITVSGCGERLVRLRVRLRYEPAACESELVDTIDVTI